MMQKPKSGYDKTGGMFYFARMVDKIRLFAAGSLHPDFHGNLGIDRGADGFCCGFLRVPYDELRTRVLQGGTDAEILEWCYERGRRLNALDLIIWNAFISKFGWNDRATPLLERLKQADGFADRAEIRTMFDYFEADEGRD